MRFLNHSWLRQRFSGPHGQSLAQGRQSLSSERSNYARAFIESTSDCVFFLDREWRFTFFNTRAANELKIKAAVIGKSIWEVFPETLGTLFEENSRRAVAERSPQVFEAGLKPLSAWYEVHAIPREDGLMIILRNITERRAAAEARMREQKLAEAELIESKRQLATLIDNLPGLVYQCGIAAPWPFTFISEGAETLTGYAARDFMEKKIDWGEIVHRDDLQMVDDAILESVAAKQVFNVVYRIRTRSGETRWVLDRGRCIYGPSGEPAFLEGIISDVTSQKEAEEQILWAAQHDHLTRLPNRALFQIRLSKALEHSSRLGCKVGLLLLDVDHLKEINDTLGHDAGDAVLQAVANRLSAAVRPIDTVARNGGDEFAVLLPEIDGEADVKRLIAPILEQLQKPLSYAGRLLDCRASIGASIWPDHAQEAADLLKQADVALYTAKATGRDKVIVFEPSMRTEAQKKAEMRSNARGAIDSRSIEPFYQPKVHLDSGELAGFEALLRWRNPRAGIELPASIQAAFDDPQLAVALSKQMHDMVFDDMRRWLQAEISFGHVAINASAAEFRGVEFADQILERLRAAEIPNHCLEIEVTETVFLGRGAEFVEKALRTLSSEGVKIALDDFGTGYASLSHLKQFPVDIIKIDRSFVHDLASNPDDPAILQAVLSLGKSLGITTVAEGVETSVQAAFLQGQGCDLGQGFLFGMASPSSSIPDLVASWKPGQFNIPELDTRFLKDRKQRR
jgi:diguanylate cyclase (GGDEF)-like protein/PAS domain S-box-containing protein